MAARLYWIARSSSLASLSAALLFLAYAADNYFLARPLLVCRSHADPAACGASYRAARRQLGVLPASSHAVSSQLVLNSVRQTQTLIRLVEQVRADNQQRSKRHFTNEACNACRQQLDIALSHLNSAFVAILQRRHVRDLPHWVSIAQRQRRNCQNGFQRYAPTVLTSAYGPEFSAVGKKMGQELSTSLHIVWAQAKEAKKRAERRAKARSRGLLQSQEGLEEPSSLDLSWALGDSRGVEDEGEDPDWLEPGFYESLKELQAYMRGNQSEADMWRGRALMKAGGEEANDEMGSEMTLSREEGAIVRRQLNHGGKNHNPPGKGKHHPWIGRRRGIGGKGKGGHWGNLHHPPGMGKKHPWIGRRRGIGGKGKGGHWGKLGHPPGLGKGHPWIGRRRGRKKQPPPPKTKPPPPPSPKPSPSPSPPSGGGGGGTIPKWTPNAVVAKDGSGQFSSVEAAVDSAPKSGSGKFVIYIKAGVYDEHFIIRKSNIVLVGESKRTVIITGDASFGSGYSTHNSVTVGVNEDGFVAMGITFRNTAGRDNHQAVALRLSSDKAAVYECDFDAHQDTLYVDSGRQYYKNVFIAGTQDFIFGDAAAVVERSQIRIRTSRAFETVTASGREEDSPTGIVILNTRVDQEGTLENPAYLGRPWKAYARTVFINCYLPNQLDQAGWLPWGGETPSTVYYAEWGSYGPGARKPRASWAKPGFISTAESAQFYPSQFIDWGTWRGETKVP